MSRPDPTYLICSPTAWGPSGVAGSTAGACSRCDRRVHVAPASVSILERLSPTVLCVPCAGKVLRQDDEFVLLPEQVPELRRALGRRAN